MKNAYFELLKQWCDELLKLQLHDTGCRELDGAIICPACQIVHGRCHDLIYPLMYLADNTGEEKYLEAARRLFDWSESLVTDDGGLYNDAQSPWQGITVFSANELCEALRYHGHLLTAEEKARWEERLRGYGEWLYNVLLPEFNAVVNYDTNCAGAMALLGEYFDDDRYRERARFMAHFCMKQITESGLLMGEGKPIDGATARGCVPVDIGYNVEESMAGLLRYAIALNDEEIRQQVVRMMHAHLEFMLPDGGWDNSFGTRNFKWTYWGSRTSDGCQSAYAILGAEYPEFAEAAFRNLEQYKKCSHGGLMYGGPHYRARGEKACTHHSFCHAGALTMALDAGIADIPRMSIPADNPPPVKYYPEVDTYKLAAGGWRATVTGYDFGYMDGGHASGGVMTMLWNEKVGPVLATGMTDYAMKEPTNQQMSLKKSSVGCMAARVDLKIGDTLYSQMYDNGSDISARTENGGAVADVACVPVDIARKAPARRAAVQLRYELQPQGAALMGWVSAAGAKAEFVLPVILSDDESYDIVDPNTVILRRAGGDVRVSHCGLCAEPRRIFNFSGGFSALELRMAPDREGNFGAVLSVM